MFWPRYFDAGSGEWRTVPHKTFSKADLRDACALCGWGRHMAIHDKPEGQPPTGTLGVHGWVSPKPPNVRVNAAEGRR